MASEKMESILRKEALERADLITLLGATTPEDIESIRRKAESVLEAYCGGDIYLRGLVEFSNICSCDCYYCGIRRSNSTVERYILSKAEIIRTAKWCAEQGYGSLVLQSGERRDEEFVDFVEDVVRNVKDATRMESLPNGLGITLCVGEQSPDTYERFFAAGAHRYLLRVETSSPALFRKIHPPGQEFEKRFSCIQSLKAVGFQVGTGVMIGFPGQTTEDLADDLLFFREMDIDMIGMGPYVVHSRTPMGRYAEDTVVRREETLRLSLLMIAAARISLRDVNIAATTALDALNPAGREQGLAFGANVMMPRLTPSGVSRCYSLYEGLAASKAGGRRELEDRSVLAARFAGRSITFNQWGDSRHYFRKRRQ